MSKSTPDMPQMPTSFGPAQSSGPADADSPTQAVVKNKIAKVATKVDSLGRILTVKFLSPLDRMRLAKILGADAKNEVYMGYAALAFAVTKIDDDSVSSNTVREVEFLVERLGDEGLLAVGECYQKDFKDLMGGADVDAAKN